jgi:nucleoside-diphosphate-sugar epimerase
VRVCVTGGRGFIGSRLVSALVRDGHSVVSLSRNTAGFNRDGVTFVQGDLAAENCQLQAFVSGCDVLFNCAGEVADINVMHQLHVDGTRRLLEAVGSESAKSGKKIHWVQLSSVGVYGPPLDSSIERVVTEESAVAPVGDYEITKYLSDELVLHAAMQNEISCAVLRPSNVFGAGMPNQSLVSLISFVKKRLFFYVGRPGAIATYVHVDDVVEALLHCATHPYAKDGEVFNLSNDCGWEDLINGVAHACNLPRPSFRLPEWFVRACVSILSRGFGMPLTQKRIDALVTRTSYPFAKINDVFGFKPTRYVPDAIRELIADAEQC